MRTNDVVMFEVVDSISSNDIREPCQVRLWIEPMGESVRFFFMLNERARLRESRGLYECWMQSNVCK